MEITERDLEIIRLLKHNPSRAFVRQDTSTKSAAYLYNKDEVAKQKEAFTGEVRVTYEDHIRVINIARNELKKDTQLDIANAILTHRFFKQYRINTFQGKGSYLKDLQFILARIGNVFDHNSSKVITKDVSHYVKGFVEPTLVQVNHLASTVSKVNLPKSSRTLEEWAVLFNKDAPESTVYVVAGVKAA